MPSTDRAAFSTQPGISPATGQPGAVSVMSMARFRSSSRVDLVDQPELVDVDRDLRVVHRLQRPDQVVGDPLDFVGGIEPAMLGVMRSAPRLAAAASGVSSRFV